MASIYDYLTFGNTISFEVYPAAIIGARYENAKVLATLDKDSANVWIDADSMHVNVYPSLPAGVPDDPDEYQYVKLKLANGSIAIVGIPWIREDTIEISQRGRLTITVEDVGPVDRERIVKALAANGYRAAKISLR